MIVIQNPLFNNDWDNILQEEFTKPYYKKLQVFLAKEYNEQTIFPERQNIWTTYELTPYDKVKVVIIGQDPYHGRGQAYGLCFSVQEGVKIPPSLRNMFTELVDDIGCEHPENGMLTGWAEQGVLLMNTVLTVREGEANSHRGKGWEQFTDEVIRQLSQRSEPIIFILWGRPAQAKKKLIDLTKHAVIESYHPSPLSASRGFFGTKPYSQANRYLLQWGKEPIAWCQTNRKI